MKTWFKTLIYLIITLFSLQSFAQINPEDINFLSEITENVTTPVRMCLNNNDILYVTDNNINGILKYDVSGNYIETLMLDFAPVSITADENDNLYIGDKLSGNIYIRKADGNISLFYEGTIFPADMEYANDGYLYIVDSKLQKVHVLDISGNLVNTIGEGTLIYPTSIAYDKKNQKVLIGEHGGIGTGFTPPCKVWMYDTDGNLIGSFGSYGDADGEFYRIHGITVGNCNNIFVSESYQGNISVFDEDGNFITKFGEFGESTGDLNVPLDIEFNTKKELLIGSYNKSSIGIFDINETLPTSNIINSDAVICKGETFGINIELTGTAPWTFTYTIDGMSPTIVNTSESNYILSVSDAGLYEISQLNDASLTGSCFTGSAQIEVSDVDPTVNISTEDQTICQGDQSNVQINFTGTSPWEFTYTQNGLDPVKVKTTNNPYNLSVSDAGLYEITTLEAKGCSGTVFDGSYNLSLNPLPTSSFSAGNGTIDICEGEDAELEAVFTGTAPWSIIYTTDDENPTTINNITESTYTLISSLQGTYEVKEITDDNCTNYISEGFPEVIIHSQSIADFEYNTDNNSVTFINHSLHSDNYYWDFDDGNTSSDLNPSHLYSSPGTYNVSLTASNTGCENIYSQTIQISSSSLEDLKYDNEVLLHPNPTDGIFNIVFKDLEKTAIEIYNVSGKIIYSEQLNSVSNRHINISDQSKGIYFVNVRSNSHNKTYKLILK